MIRRAAAILLAAGVSGAGVARAEWQPETAASAAVLFRSPALGGGRAYGARFSIDAWHRLGLGRVGLAAGIGFLGGGSDADARTYVPLGLSLGLAERRRTVGYDLRVRGGPWLGATDAGLAVGAFVDAAAHLSFRLTSALSLTTGFETQFLFAHGNALVLAPAVSLVFTPEAEHAP